MKRDLVLAVDVGSAGARAAVVSCAGHLLDRATQAFSVHRPATGDAEHSSDEIWGAVSQASRQAIARADIDASRIAGLAVDATCSVAMFDRAGRPVTVSSTGEDRWNVIMWADQPRSGRSRGDELRPWMENW